MKVKSDNITVLANKIYDDIHYLVKVDGLNYDDVIGHLHTKFEKPISSIPSLKQLRPHIKRLLRTAADYTSIVHNATLIQESDAGDYLGWVATSTERVAGYSFYHNVYAASQSKKQYSRASCYLARTIGIASLAMKDGLDPFFVTITLPSQYHVSSLNWNNVTPDESAKLLTERWAQFNTWLRNNKIRIEWFRGIETHGDGTPHMHITLFTDEQERVEEALQNFFYFPDGPQRAVHFKHSRNVKACLRYMVKTFWGPHKYQNKPARTVAIWSQKLKARRIAFGSRMRKLLPLKIWNPARKGIRAIQHSSFPTVLRYQTHPDGTEQIFVAGKGYSSLDDAYADINHALHRAAIDGDYASAQRLYQSITATTLLSPNTQRLGPSAMASLGETELRTISQDEYLNLDTLKSLMAKTWDFEDVKWLLRKRLRPRMTAERIKSLKFLKKFENSLKAAKQTP